MILEFDPGSFRDPRGRVYYSEGAVFREIHPPAEADFDVLTGSGLLAELVARGWTVSAEEVRPADGSASTRAVHHNRMPFISYPYEWPFSLLKAAALHHIDVHLLGLDHGMTLSDGSAYNVQFDGIRPVFIDILSFTNYNDGDLWLGHQQFSDHFLHPLLFTAHTGVPFNSRLRGDIEGLNGAELLRLLPLWAKLRPRTFLNVTLPNRLAQKGHSARATPAAPRPLPKEALVFLLRHLRKWIGRLQPDFGQTAWADYYQASHNYEDAESKKKAAVVADFCNAVRPDMLWDVGCNTGAYSEIALASGAGRVIGFDFDPVAIEGAYRRAVDKSLTFTPLYQDSANPSPDQGWSGQERRSLQARCNGDAILALALEHHLAIGRNVPLDKVVEWLVGLAPRGLIEFIPKGDSNLERLLRHRKDIFAEYDERNFEHSLGLRARIVRKDVVSTSGRTLYWYDRSR